MVVAPLPDGVLPDRRDGRRGARDADASCVQALLDARGPERGPHEVTEVIWGSRFRVHHRVADIYRAGRLLLAGDAAHVHSPAGGQGMNLGIHDAIALADALSCTLAGRTPRLDAYGAARRPIAQQVVALADAADPPGHRAGTRPPGPQRRDRVGVPPSGGARGLAWRLSGLIYR